MALWRVDVCGLAHRFVDADTKKHAEKLVTEALVAALDIRASKAHRWLAEAYASAGPIQRKNLLAHVDGLTNPRERQDARSARRRLARLMKRDQEERSWLRSQVEASPPVSPELADEVARLLAITHVERSFTRLPEWNQRSPWHGDRL